MTTPTDLKLYDFRVAHQSYYDTALQEIKNGKKLTHWMWYIFPQLPNLGTSENSKHYSLTFDEAVHFYMDKYLKGHLIEIVQALLDLPGHNAMKIFGEVDADKLRSSMTLFYLATDNNLFVNVLNKYFDGCLDYATLREYKKGS